MESDHSVKIFTQNSSSLYHHYETQQRSTAGVRYLKESSHWGDMGVVEIECWQQS
jgi:hypothetical protein